MKYLAAYITQKIHAFSEACKAAPWKDYFQVGFYAFVILIIIANAIGGGAENNAYGY